MGKVQVLSSQLANIIAAGEVVARPSSVVKELMENAVDAGAKSISVIITDAGRTNIQVIDDGCGMSPEDAKLCFERHATSKIASNEDLEAVMTYGFRGEALPSIASIAEIDLKTRTASDQTATRIEIGSFAQMNVSSCQAPVGTNISVRNLFYNTPARRKFLKSDNIELKHIISEFTHVALSCPQLSLSLSHNGHTIFSLGKANAPKFRILDVLGEGVVGDIVDVSCNSATVRINGFASRPEGAKKTLGNQFFFVNGRFFKSPYLHKAVMNAYADMIPDGVTPSYILYLEVDPRTVDVNVSPTKSEVKFEEDSAVFQAVYACVRSAIGHNVREGSLDFEGGAVEFTSPGRSFEEYRPQTIAPSAEFDPLYNPFDVTPGGWTDRRGDGDAHALFDSQETEAFMKASGASQSASLPYGKEPLVVRGRFVVVESASGMMVIDAKKAVQRVFYEQALLSLRDEGESVASQALFPCQIQVGPAPRLLFDESAETLRKIGFDIAPLGTDTIAVSAVPAGFENENIQDMVGELIAVLAVDAQSVPEVMRATTARKFSAMASRFFSPITTTAQAQSLLDSLFSCENTETTPQGAKISWIIPLEEIEKKF